MSDIDDYGARNVPEVIIASYSVEVLCLDAVELLFKADKSTHYTERLQSGLFIKLYKSELIF